MEVVGALRLNLSQWGMGGCGGDLICQVKTHISNSSLADVWLGWGPDMSGENTHLTIPVINQYTLPVGEG